MSIRVSKPAFNLRDKLNELDGKVPLHKMPHGSIIQVKNLEYDTIFSSSHSGSQYVDVTDFNLDFAPKFKTSEILIEAAVAGGLNDNYGYNFRFRVVRTIDNANLPTAGIGEGTAQYSMTGGYNLYDSNSATPYIFGMSKTFMDKPGTTEKINYKIQVAHTHSSSGATVYVNRRGSGSNWTSISTLTIMEVR